MMHNTGIKSGSAETATGALSVDGPQPVWMTLNEARERGFTGEVVFEIDPEVLAYFDNGVVYYAERATDVSLGRRLLEAGVIESAQLERGTVRVGDVEHLGRLFDRDATVDRDAVLVVTETSTEDLIADLANSAIATVRVTAYRHHASGVHRWFVTQIDAGSAPRPLSEVPQIGTTVVDDLPGLTMVGLDADELTIEWDEPFDELDEFPESSATIDEFVMELQSEFAAADAVASLVDDDVVLADDLDESVAEDSVDAEVLELSMVMAEFVDTDDDSEIELIEIELIEEDPEDTAAVLTDAADDRLELDASESDVVDFEFAVVWPDGSEEQATAETAYVETQDELTPAVPTPMLAAPVVTNEQGELRFEMPPLALSDDADEVSNDEVPDDVAHAVRQAIAAIESATTEVPVIPPVAAQPVAFESPAPAVSSFAPPTMAMRAEVLYGQVADEAADVEVASTGWSESAPALDGALAEPPATSVPTLGVASVVFVDDDVDTDDDAGDSNDRSSALRRLIGSLRRKDR